MRHFRTTIVLALATFLSVAICSAQQASTTSVPNLIRYSGTLKDAPGTASVPSTTVGVTFAIYKQQDGGTAVWMETQNVTPDASGQYSVVLGGTTATGLPNDLFSQQEQRWLGIQVQGQAEQARVLLVSVPYAFKAHEAETLGGLPPSAFVKAPPSDGSGSGSTVAETGTSVNAGGSANAGGTASSGKTESLLTPGTPGFIPIWLGGTSFISSNIYQDSSANIGIGTLTPLRALDVNGQINAQQWYDIGATGLAFASIGYGPGVSVHGGNTYLGVGAGTTNPLAPGDAHNYTYDNTFVGAGAGSHTTGSASGNTFIGAGAGNNNGSSFGGLYNTYVGAYAGSASVRGFENTYFGWAAGGNALGSDNAFFGWYAGANTSGNQNTFLGQGSGSELSSGDGNIMIGYQAGIENLGNADGDIYIGNTGQFSESNTIRIGGGQTATYIAGISGSTVGGNGTWVFVDTNGHLGTFVSSRRFKEQIADMGDSSSRLFQLRPVTFLYKPEYDKGERTLQYGLIAEEVAKVYPDLVAYDKDGQPYTVKYQYLAPMLLNELQKQHTVVAAQQDVIKTQQEQIQTQGQQIADLQQRLSRLEALIAKK